MYKSCFEVHHDVKPYIYLTEQDTKATWWSAERGAPGRGLKVVRAFTNSWGGGGFMEFDDEFKFAKIQNSHFVCVGGGGRGGVSNFWCWVQIC